MQLSCHGFGLLNLPVTKYGKNYFKRSCEDCFLFLLLLRVVVASRYWWSCDCLTKLFGSHKRYCDGQWLLTGCYFKRCNVIILRLKIRWSFILTNKTDWNHVLYNYLTIVLSLPPPNSNIANLSPQKFSTPLLYPASQSCTNKKKVTSFPHYEIVLPVNAIFFWILSLSDEQWEWVK